MFSTPPIQTARSGVMAGSVAGARAWVGDNGVARGALTVSVLVATVLCSLPAQAEGNPFDLNVDDLSPISYSRIDQEDSRPDAPTVDINERQTQLSFKLRPTRPDFSRKGAYGLGMLGITRPELSVQSGSSSGTRPGDLKPQLHQGFSYSAGIKVEHDDQVIDGTAYVSSSQLGLSYGRLGRIWYGGLDVNLEQFNADAPGFDNTSSDQLSVDFTTGGRLGFGRADNAPIWLLSLEGNFDVAEVDNMDAAPSGEWFLNPGLFWQKPGFSFSAELHLPMDAVTTTFEADELPDYRLRAVIEKQF